MSFPVQLVLAMTLFSGTGSAADSAPGAEYWQALEWQHRPLLMVVGSGERETQRVRDWEDRLLANRCALAERRIHWLEIREDGVWRRFAGDHSAGFESTRLGQRAAESVRQRVAGLGDGASRLALFGLDGQRKYLGQPESLEPIWSLIDGMPMRRAELARDPDDCEPR